MVSKLLSTLGRLGVGALAVLPFRYVGSIPTQAIEVKDMSQTEEKIKQSIIERAEQMAKALAHGKDLEVRKSASGVSVAEVTKKIQR